MAFTKAKRAQRLSEIFSNIIDEEETLKGELLVTLEALANELDTHERNSNIADVAFASSGIVASGLTVAGAVTGPFTLGSSLSLTIGGLALGVTSGAGTLGNNIATHLISCKQLEKAQSAKDKYFESVDQMMKFAYVLKESGHQEMLGVDLKGERFVKTKFKVRKKVPKAVNRTVGTSGQVIRIAAISYAIATRKAVEATSSSVASVLKSGMMAAKLAGAVVSALSLPLDIYTLIVSSQELQKRTPAEGAQEIRMSIQNLQQLHIFRDDCPEEEDDSDANMENSLQYSDGLKTLLLCTNCLENVVDVIYLPCGHVSCCSVCLKYFKRCSVCTERIQDTVGRNNYEEDDMVSSLILDDSNEADDSMNEDSESDDDDLMGWVVLN